MVNDTTPIPIAIPVVTATSEIAAKPATVFQFFTGLSLFALWFGRGPIPEVEAG